MTRWPLEDHNRLVLRRLRSGDRMQQAPARSIRRTGLLKVLQRYSPLIVGTLPIDVHLRESDVGIICHVKAFRTFATLLERRLGNLPLFALRTTTLQRRPAVVCSFTHQDTPFEIVGMPVAARAAIRRLRREGLKTEPAFARHFGLAGNPYQAVAGLWRGFDRPLNLHRVTRVTTARLARLPSLKS